MTLRSPESWADLIGWNDLTPEGRRYVLMAAARVIEKTLMPPTEDKP